mmetsp:Transcript_25842/g.49083  ORF Transcript_25842/g.49083 Transcript_25842/m.49083 type:complete len:214 (+) Transcript_25842:1426-2067(+)
MPSTTYRSLSTPLDSSMVITPLRPTRAMAEAIMSPTSLFPPADTAATEASSESSTSLDSSLSSFTRCLMVLSMPRVSCTGFAPAATIFIPSATNAADRMVAVVVPSPAWSLVREAAWRTSFAPMFSTGSSSSISFATVTPSFTILGDPYLDSRTTLRPFGPRVTPTVLASLSTPACMRLSALPSWLNTSSLAMHVVRAAATRARAGPRERARR